MGGGTMSVTLLVDCGTTNLRVTALDDAGHVLAQTRRDGGVRHTAVDGHNGRLKAMLADGIGEVLRKADLEEKNVSRCVAYGMITSNVGLLEIPHLPAPVNAVDLHKGMQTASFPEIASFPITFIPGVRNFAGRVTLDNFSGMDMMRGEETEAVGLFELLHPDRECVMILPGSHNKFVRMDADGHILGCMTSISGELLDAMTHHTILANAVGGEFADAGTYDVQLVRQGAHECMESGIGRAAFAGRILNQLGEVDSARLRSYLLGVVLAQDVIALKKFVPDIRNAKILIAGKAPLQRAIADVMEIMGLPDAVQVEAEISGQMGICGALKIAEG